MCALLKSKAERGLWLEQVPEPKPGINDVLIRVLMTGICGTDLHIYADQACTVLLAAAGRRASDAAAVWKHGAADCRVALADRIRVAAGK